MTRLNRTVKCALCYLRCFGSSAIVAVAAVALLLPMSRPAAAAVLCQQECASGACAQVSCGRAASGGFSHCTGGLLSWNDGAYTSWCLAWGQPLASSGLPGSTAEVGTSALADDAISHPEAMTAAVRAANPWVAALLAALHDARWANGPTQGLLHESYVDATMTTRHSAARDVHGSLTAGGRHGTLLVSATDGRQQAIQW